MMGFINSLKRYILSAGHQYMYFGSLFLGAIIWVLLVNNKTLAYFYIEYWSSGLTMLFGSFFAGSTPLGGGAVAFPVFTKLLDIQVEDARTFSLMIQSVGMSFATLFFMSKKIWIDWKLILISLPGSVIGLYLGNEYLNLRSDIVKFIFTEFIILTGFMYFFSKKISLATHTLVNQVYRFMLLVNLFSFIGGLIVTKIGSGADVALFFILVFLLGNNAQESTPTTVAFMAINSLIAVFFIVPIDSLTDFVEGSWWISAPIVALGAPVGGWVLSKLSLKKFEVLLFLVFGFEIISSLLYSRMHFTSRLVILLSVVCCLGIILSRSNLSFRKNSKNSKNLIG